MKKSTRHILGALSLAFVQMLSTSVVQASEAGSKEPIAFQRGDLNAILGGKTRQEYMAAKNTTLLNNNLPDDASFFRHIGDLFVDVSWGEKKYGHKAIQWFVDFRQRNLWGDSGRYVQTGAETVKVSDSVVGAHNHKIFRPLVWVRDLWLQASLNAILGIEGKTTHFVKGGLFPFWLGRGIALGPYYGVTKDFLGLYTYLNDQAAPGVLFSGEIVPELVTYDVYYSKFEDKSATLNDTFNHVKANHIGRRETPWRGVAKDNELWAARVKWIALDDEESGNMVVEPYIFYNEASDQNIEPDAAQADAKSMLGTVGVALEWTYNNLEMGGEIAFNFGHELVKAIDRNRVTIRRREATDLGISPDNFGDLQEVFTHVIDAMTQLPIVATKANRAILEQHAPVSCDNLRNFNSEVTVNRDECGRVTSITQDSSQQVTIPTQQTWVSAPWVVDGNINPQNRFRPEKRVDYRGWMFVFDAAYNIPEHDLKPAIGYAYASGDANPHEDETCDSVNYNGWVGINENYAGTRVPSLMVLDARKLAQPLVFNSETPFALNDNSFSDMHIVGGGVSWTPIDSNPTRFKLNPNILAYWKAHRSDKFDINQDKLMKGCKASRFLGTEFNVFANYELLKDLQLIIQMAIFFPGTFYHDVRGTKLSSQKFKQLDLVDRTGFDSQNYGLDRDVSYYIKTGVEFGW